MADDVGERLAGWASEQFGGDVVVVAPATPVGGGFDAEIVGVQLGGAALPAEWRRPLIMRLPPGGERLAHARGEAAALAWCGERGYPVPRVLAVLEPGTIDLRPVQVMLRVPGMTMADAIKRAPWRARSMVDRLADLQLRLHSISPAGWPLSTAPTALAEKRLQGTRRTVAGGGGGAALAAALARADTLVPATGTDSPVVCHGDFHPLNVLVDGAASYVIDWTDCGLGDRHGDVARTALLFELATIAASSRLQHIVLDKTGARMSRRYLATYGRGFTLDPERLRRWTVLHLVDGWGQAIARSAAVPAGFAELLQRRTEALLAELAA